MWVEIPFGYFNQLRRASGFSPITGTGDLPNLGYWTEWGNLRVEERPHEGRPEYNHQTKYFKKERNNA